MVNLLLAEVEIKLLVERLIHEVIENNRGFLRLRLLREKYQDNVFVLLQVVLLLKSIMVLSILVKVN